MKLRAPALGRFGWGVADQAVSSLENFLLGVFVARSFGSEGLGVLGLALLAYMLTVGVSRGLTTDPLAVRFSASERGAWTEASRAALATAVCVGAVGGLVVALVSLFLVRSGSSSLLTETLVLLAITMPALTVQDAWRYVFFSGARGKDAFLNDLVWTAVLALLLVIPFMRQSPATVILSFGLSAAVAVALGVWQAKFGPRLSGIPGWLREHRDLSIRFVTENFTLGTGSQVRSLVVAKSVGLVAVGAIRGVEVLMGPAMAVLMGVAQVAVPEAVRRLAEGHQRLLHLCIALSGGLASAAAAWGTLVAVLFPRGIGQAVLGSAWHDAEPLIIAATITAAGVSTHVGAAAGLRGLGRADMTLRSQFITSACAIVLSGAGALWWGAAGAVRGSAIAAVIGGAVWWYGFTRALKEWEKHRPEA